jgi:hypothetical protein
MHEPSFPRTPSRSDRFVRPGRSGHVRAFYGVTRRPADSGFLALPGWSRARRAGVGFPTLKCEVETEDHGYWNYLGWIQWVTQEFADGRRPVRMVDRVPAQLDRDVPFVFFGYAPTFFDAPAFNSRPAVDWRATAFLCVAPIMQRSESVTPLVGYTWGYRIERAGGDPVPYPLRPATADDWEKVRRGFARRHPRWTFAGVYRRRAPE